MTLLATLSLVIVALAAIPALTLAVECLAALVPLRRWKIDVQAPRPPLAVLVPAHNEQDLIADTVRAAARQLLPHDRLLVIADNCTDATAQRAQEAGAEVLVRHDALRRGKGYALCFAHDKLRAAPPQIVVSIDADCTPLPGCIDNIARLAHQRQRPVQAAYLMAPLAQDQQPGLSAVSALAVLVKNYVRPRGLQRLGLPCLMTGSGMAFPWKILESVPQPPADLVEDMRYAVDLAIAAVPPLPCMEAEVHAALPTQQAAFVSQRRRWEHGHLATIAAEAPRLLTAFLRTGRPTLVTLLLELAVPPLSLLLAGLGLLGVLAAAVSWAAADPLPIVVAAGAILAVGVGVASAWVRFGRHTLPPRLLLELPRYFVAKLPIYRAFVTGREQTWVRTQRADPATTGVPQTSDRPPLVPPARTGPASTAPSSSQPHS